jgi:hypothetical protein
VDRQGCLSYLAKRLKNESSFHLGARGTVGHPFEQAYDDPIELGRGRLIHRLIQIVGRLVIAVANKIVENLIFRRAELVAEFERQGGHALANEAVLIAADEAVLLWFLIGLHADTKLLGRLANGIAEGGFRQPLHFDPLQVE